MTENVTNLKDLVNRCILFTDRKGVLVGKGSHPFGSWLSMTYNDKSISISFRVQHSPYSNGSSYVKVDCNGETVLEAEGSFITFAFDIQSKKYVSGDWEKRIPTYDNILKR